MPKGFPFFVFRTSNLRLQFPLIFVRNFPIIFEENSVTFTATWIPISKEKLCVDGCITVVEVSPKADRRNDSTM